jgi:hypothetical protein
VDLLLAHQYATLYRGNGKEVLTLLPPIVAIIIVAAAIVVGIICGQGKCK